MTLSKRTRTLVAGALVFGLVGLPISEAFAQGRGKRSSNSSRSSVRQSHQNRKDRHKARRPKPPHRRPPAYHPPRPRPPVYRPRPPRYRGPYYGSYSLWRAAVGVTAVIAIGTILATPPPQSTTVIIQEKTYYVHEDVYYEQVLHGDEVAYQVVPKP